MSNIDKQAGECDVIPKMYYIHPMAFGGTQNPGNGHVPVVHADDFEKQRAKLEAAEKRIAELEVREVNGRFPLPKDSSQGWKIDPEFIGKIQDAIGYDEECQCWEGSPSMEMVEAVLIAAAAIKMDERG